MTTLTRRTLLAAGGIGAAGVAIGGCGTEEDPRAETDDAGLLADALAAELALAEAFEQLAREGGAIGRAAREFAAEQRERIDRLQQRGEPAGGGADELDLETAEGGTLGGVTAAANAAIGAYREAAALLSTADDRALAIGALAQIAAQLAALRSLTGEQPAPSAFVVGAGG